MSNISDLVDDLIGSKSGQNSKGYERKKKVKSKKKIDPYLRDLFSTGETLVRDHGAKISLSKHLAPLRSCGVLQTFNGNGKKKLYRLANDRVLRVERINRGLGVERYDVYYR